MSRRQAFTETAGPCSTCRVGAGARCLNLRYRGQGITLDVVHPGRPVQRDLSLLPAARYARRLGECSTCSAPAGRACRDMHSRELRACLFPHPGRTQREAAVRLTYGDD